METHPFLGRFAAAFRVGCEWLGLFLNRHHQWCETYQKELLAVQVESKGRYQEGLVVNMHPHRYEAEIMLKTWAIFTDIHFPLSILSKPRTPDFSQKVFSESPILFFLDRVFFPASLTLCTRGSCSLLLSDEYIQGSVDRVQGTVMTVSKAATLSFCWWGFITHGFISAHICLSCSADPFLPQHLIFHLNCRRLQFLGQGVWLSSVLCDCHGVDLYWQELKRFECWGNHKLWDCKNEYKTLPDKKK